MIKYAITGNIACGKSTAEKILSDNGFKVIDTDEIGHKMLDCEEIHNAFKNFEVFENNKISREKLGRLVFNNSELKKRLEKIIHPKIRSEIISFFGQNKNEKYLFVSIPLVFETGMEDLFDKIIMIYADDEIRLNRLIKRNGYTEEYAKTRMSCQMNQNEKAQKSDIVIYNNSSAEELKQQILKIIE